MLHFIQSNKLEKLFARLCEIIGSLQMDPLQPVEIVVQNPGMGRWLSQQMAIRKGIAANLQFPLPARFIWKILAGQLDLSADTGIFDRRIMLWRIHEELDACRSSPMFAEIKGYLSDDRDGRKAFHLAARIADLFDQYLVYRPDMLLQWEQSLPEKEGPSIWQAALWQKLVACEEQHRARHFGDFFARCEAGELDKAKLPGTVCIFGVSSLAPVYLQVVKAIERYVDVNVFYLNPCRQLWDDIVSDAERARKRTDSLANGEMYYYKGNPLLASQGKVGREFLGLIFDLDLTVEDENNCFVPVTGNSMLATLQMDILDLVDRADTASERAEIPEGDRSVQFHSCHSRMREVQVLHDRLLDMFTLNPELKPGDVLIMAPNMEHYGATVRSVFNAANENMFIPWSLADSSVSGEEPLAASFLSLIELCTGRCSAPEVVSFLETEAVLRRFGLDEPDLAVIRDWVEESGIRWGLDREHRKQFGCLMGDEHSWNFGLNRLMMGYLVGDEHELVHSISACGNPSSNESVLVGNLVAFASKLQATRQQMQSKIPPDAWADLFFEMLDDFYDPGSSEEEQQGLHILRDTVFRLRDDCRQAGFTADVTLPVIADWFRQELLEPSGGQGFLSGKVTFCNMVPMRSVPFKVICLLGMNDTDYPRQQMRPGFDLMGRKPRLGDRNRRDDDRYLFLEALISAREVLYISWIGRDQQDNSYLPPSVVVADLIDYMRRGFGGADNNREHWPIVEHSLQPFSPKCFSDEPERQSYATQWLPVQGEEQDKPFVSLPLDDQPEELRTVELARLLQFWSHPVRFFLEQRLDMKVRDEDDLLEENEPFQPDGLVRYSLETRLVEASLQEQNLEDELFRLTAAGKLPHGNFGRNFYHDLCRSVEEIVPVIKPFTVDPQEPQEVDLAVGPYRLAGRLGGLFAAGCIRYRPAKLKGRDMVRLWVEHLVFNSLGRGGQSVYVASDDIAVLQQVADPLPELGKLLDLYWKGLAEPLHFYPETSLAWFAAADEKKLREALKKWNGGYMTRAEGDELAYHIALAGNDPLDKAFQVLADEIYGPIHNCRLGDDDSAAV